MAEALSCFTPAAAGGQHPFVTAIGLKITLESLPQWSTTLAAHASNKPLTVMQAAAVPPGRSRRGKQQLSPEAEERIAGIARKRKLEERKKWREMPREQKEELEVWRVKGPVGFAEKHPLWRFYRIPGIEKALEVEGDAVDAATYASLLRKCGRERSLQDGKLVHDHIKKHSDERDTFLGNLLVQMYGRCRSPEDARQVFDNILQRNPFSWSIMVECYVQNGQYEMALEMYRSMESEGVVADGFTMSSVVAACTKLRDLAAGRRVHKAVVDAGLDADVVVGTALLHMYSKCGSLEDAIAVFEKMGSSSIQDTFLTTAMIGGYVRHGRGEEALDLYWRMRGQGIEPDAHTYAAVLGACSSPRALLEGRHIHKQILESEQHSGNMSVKNALITMYGKCGSLEEAKNLFEGMSVKDLVTWNAMIAAYALHGHSKEAFGLFYRMGSLGLVPDIFTFSSILSACCHPNRLQDGKSIHARIIARGFDRDHAMQNCIINMYTKCGSLQEARRMFDGIQQKELGTWNTMLAGYAQFDEGKQALLMYRSMLLEGFQPDRFTFSSIIDSCASLGAFREGRAIHECSVAKGLEKDLVLGTAIVNMYAKCGSLDEARNAFDQIEHKDVVSWSAMIAANAQHGHAEEAVELSYLMNLDGVEQNDFTASSILHACSHGGLLAEGVDYFLSCNHDYGFKLNVEQCVGLIDLLGRAGWLKEAEHVINTMPFEPSFVAWVTMLSACKVHGDVKRGKLAAKKLIKMQPENSGAYILLNNIYAAAGRWDDVGKLRRYMRKTGVKRETGWSSIEFRNKVHEFTVGDMLHPRNEEIRSELERLYAQMEEEGYTPDTTEVFHDVSDEEKEDLLKYHSEKMAMAFGLITTEPGTTLRIVKNLRVCSDCHTVGKFVSRIKNREIIVRDGTRFHHFRDGLCSCRDYW